MYIGQLFYFFIMFFKEKVTIKYLSSGARLVHVSSEQPISVVSAWVHGGSRFDPIGKEGLSHFFEHLLMKRTDAKQDRTSHTQMLERYGIDAFAYTNSETAYFYQTQTNNQTIQSLSFLIKQNSPAFRLGSMGYNTYNDPKHKKST